MSKTPSDLPNVLNDPGAGKRIKNKWHSTKKYGSVRWVTGALERRAAALERRAAAFQSCVPFQSVPNPPLSLRSKAFQHRI